MATGSSTLESLGPGTVRLMQTGAAVEVRSIHIVGEGPLPTGAIVVELTPESNHLRQQHLLAEAAACESAAVVFRAELDPQVALPEGMTVAHLDARMTSSHFLWLLHTVSNREERTFADSATVQQELFRLADAIGSLLDASITIEDSRSRVIAYSSSHGHLDPARTSTIMGRAVPEDVKRQLRAAGVLRRVGTEQSAFLVPASEPDFRQRLVVPVRVGSETLGSVWAIWEGSLVPELLAELDRISAAVAVQLVQLGAQLAEQSRYSLDRVRQVLRGGGDESHAEFALPFEQFRVVALARLSSSSAFDDVSVWRSYLQRHAWADPILADVDGRAFAIVGDAGNSGAAGHWAWLRDLATNRPLGGVAASRAASTLTQIPGMRAEALDVLTEAETLRRPAADYQELWAAVVLRRARATVSPDDVTGVRELLHADRESGSELALTVLRWLEASRDVTATARALHVHPNTVRYRLKQAQASLPAIDFDHAADRLALALILGG